MPPKQPMLANQLRHATPPPVPVSPLDKTDLMAGPEQGQQLTLNPADTPEAASLKPGDAVTLSVMADVADVAADGTVTLTVGEITMPPPTPSGPSTFAEAAAKAMKSLPPTSMVK